MKNARFSAAVWPLLAASAMAAVGVAAALTFKDYGIGWDGRVQDVYGQKLLAYYLSGFRDSSAFTYANLRFYGGFFDLIAAAANRISPFGEFETRHLLGAVILLAGLGGAWRLTHLIAGPRAASIAVLCLAVTPVLYGHAFINPKDSPFAWLLVWVTYFSCRMLDPAKKPTRVTYVGWAVFLGCAIGTKVFALAYVGYLAAALFFIFLAASHDGNKPVCAVVGPFLWAAPLAGVVAAVFWPWAVLSPGNVIDSVATFLNFPHQVPVLWEGATFSSIHPPARYLPVLLGLKLPEYALSGLVLFILVAALNISREGIRVLATARGAQLLFVAMSALVPIAAFVVLRPTVYNGLRQYLFVVPPLVILAAVGIDRALAVAERQWRVAGAALGAVLMLLLAREAIIMSRVHPYEYVVFNSFAGDLAQAGRDFELDYWGTSLAEASRDLSDLLARDGTSGLGHPGNPRVFVCGDRMSAEYFAPRGMTIVDTVADADFILEPDAAVCGLVSHSGARTVLEIRRDGAVMGRILDRRTRETVQTFKDRPHPR